MNHLREEENAMDELIRTLNVEREQDHTTAHMAALGRAHGPWRRAVILVVTIGISVVACGAFLASVYGFATLLSTLSHANVALIAAAVGGGAVIQVVRARRAAILLSRQRRVRLGDTYNAMVVGHGIGDLVPVIPAGVALRSFLTDRLSLVPIAFSAGVFMLEGVLDGIGPALVTGFLLLASQLQTWVRIVLVVTICQSVLLFALPLVAHVLRRSRRLSVLPGWMTRLIVQGGDVADGLASGLSQGWFKLLSVAGLSVLTTALGCLQLVLFLSAFGLTTSASNVLLILVLTLVAGSLPIKFPGSGTLATAAVLQVTSVHGPGVVGFVLMSRAVLSSETTLLACVTLVWWAATGRMADLRLGVALRSLYHARWHTALRQVRSMGSWVGRVVSVPATAFTPRKLWARGLIVALGLFGIVVLSDLLSSSLMRHAAVIASPPVRNPSSMATAGANSGDGAQDAINPFVTDIPDNLRDGLRTGVSIVTVFPCPY
jgi:hypothetical protein